MSTACTGDPNQKATGKRTQIIEDGGLCTTGSVCNHIGDGVFQ
jgi:hypothetical protein